MRGKYQLIFALTQHKIFGFVVEAFRVEYLKNNEWSLGVRNIYDESSQHLNFEITPQEREILKLTKLFREEHIIKNFQIFYDKNSKTSGFSNENINNYIVPYISKNVFTLIKKIFDYNLTLALYDSDKKRILKKKLYLEEKYLEPNFSFELIKNNLIYKLKLRVDNKDVPISELKIITTNPGLVLWDDKLYPLPEDLSANLIKPFIQKEQIQVPENHINKYIDAFVKPLVRKFNVYVSGFKIEEKTVSPEAILSVSKKNEKFVIELYFKYNQHIIPYFASQNSILALNKNELDIKFEKYNRNLEVENNYINYLLQRNYLDKNTHFEKENEATHYSDVGDYLSKHYNDFVFFKNNGLVLDIKENSSKFLISEFQINSSAKKSNDWFDFHIEINIDGKKIKFEQLIQNIITNNPYYKIDENTFYIIPNEWFSKFKDLAIFASKRSNKIRLHKSQLGLIYNLRDFANVPVPKLIVQLAKKQIPEYPVPKTLKATLRSYQKKGFEWMMFLYKQQLSGCLADDMGLGKTIQAIAYMLAVKEENGDEKKTAENVLFEDLFTYSDKIFLVVAPLSLLFNWKEELAKFAPNLNVTFYIGNDRKNHLKNLKYYDVVLTTYGIIRSDIEELKKMVFHTIFLDESQIIKNAETKTFEAIIQLQSKQRFILTGTPIENSITDLWSQMTFLNPLMLGEYNEFCSRYQQKFENGNNYENLLEVNKIVQPFILRRTKNDVLKELPPLTEKICYCQMTEEHKSYYEKRKSEIRNFILENSVARQKLNILILSGLTKLRLIANHPGIIDKNYKETSGKFIEIYNYINKIVQEQHKAIIFSQFVKHLNLFAECFEREKIEYRMLTGKVRGGERQKLVSDFQKKDEVRFFLCTLKAGGLGLNLTAAEYVLLIDPWWNPSVEMQAINRAHRIGQNNSVFVYKFITKDTIEEKILKLQQEKQNLFNTVINHNVFDNLTEEEVLALFE